MSRLEDLVYRQLRRVRRHLVVALVAIRRTPLRVTATSTLVAWLFFLVFPGVDLAISGLFYVPTRGFVLQDHPVLVNLREFGIFITWSLGLLSAAVFVAPLVSAGQRLFVPARRGLFMLASLLLGPGFIVNALLKEASGRPRPRDIVAFGGHLPFLPPGVFSDYCQTNCSFASGEASSAAWLIATVFVVPKKWRRDTLKLALLLAIPISCNRLAFGGHFLSDMLIGWGLTLIVIFLTRGWILYGGAAEDDAFDRALGRAGMRVATWIGRLFAFSSRRDAS